MNVNVDNVNVNATLSTSAALKVRCVRWLLMARDGSVLSHRSQTYSRDAMFMGCTVAPAGSARAG
jgi:hypothetical protein